MTFRIKRQNSQVLLLLLLGTLLMRQLHAQKPVRKEVFIVPVGNGYDTCQTIDQAGRKWFDLNRKSDKGDESQNTYKGSTKSESGSSVLVAIQHTWINRAGEGGAAKPEKVTDPVTSESTNIMIDFIEGKAKPGKTALSKQPGEWHRDFEGGTNMSDSAAAYEARVCNKKPGMGYYVDGVQFDGFIDNVLIDAKYYTQNSGTTKALLKNNYFIGTRSIAQAERQVKAAAGRQVEWRVASQAARDKLQELFTRNNVPVKVTFVP